MPLGRNGAALAAFGEMVVVAAGFLGPAEPFKSEGVKLGESTLSRFLLLPISANRMSPQHEMRQEILPSEPFSAVRGVTPVRVMVKCATFNTIQSVTFRTRPKIFICGSWHLYLHIDIGRKLSRYGTGCLSHFLGVTKTVSKNICSCTCV